MSHFLSTAPRLKTISLTDLLELPSFILFHITSSQILFVHNPSEQSACRKVPTKHAMAMRFRQISLIFFIMLSIPDIQASTWRIPATEVKYRIAENSPPGHILGVVVGTIPQKSVTNALGAPSQFFHLDPVTSELSLKTEIDAEKLCALASRREDEKGMNGGLTDVVTCNTATGDLSVQLDVNILLPDGGLQAVFKVTVEILDVDDNPPRFDNRMWKRHLREAVYRKGHKIDLPKARDTDLLPEHRSIRYRLEQNFEDTFHLEDLDAETQDYFNMTLVAFSPSRGSLLHGIYPGDKTSDQLESRLQVEIYVDDMNDNEPFFDKPNYNITVPEDTLPGTAIFQLKAHDADRSAQLAYSLVESHGTGGSQAVASIFEVDRGGRVILRRPLDFESRKSYTLPVTVTDGDFSAETTLYVAVADVNDEAPRFEINPIHLSVEEETSAKRLIGQVRVFDPDSMEVNGVVRCKEPEEWTNRQALLFSPDPQSRPSAGGYDLQTRIKLDREGPDTLAGGIALVRLICWDGNEMSHSSGEPTRRLTSTMTATLTIRDINDNSPTFLQSIYHVAVAENNHIGAKLIQVQAHDPDDGENAEITYSLLDRANFHVDPVSGWVTAAVEFDREKRDSYQLTIIASDNGSQRLTGSALINVTILDQNDNVPQLVPCDKMSNPLLVWENSPVGTFVGNLIATDADVGRNGEIVFRLPKKLASMSHFELRSNGSLFTALPLDREQKITLIKGWDYKKLLAIAAYEFLVEVRDRGTPNALSSTETVCITVLDENDNDPHFVLPDRLYSLEDRLLDSPLRKRESIEMVSDAGTSKPIKDGSSADLNFEPSLRVSLRETQGQLVTRLEATDPDEGPNGRVIYGLRRHAHSRARVNRAAGDFLGVDGNTGEVWLKRALQEEDLGPHIFVVSANDQGAPMSRSESKAMLVSVENIPPRAMDGGSASSSFIASADGSGAEGGVLANLFPFKLGERKNVIILVGLVSISVILAVALIAAMICMLKPCRAFSRQPRRFFNQDQMSPTSGFNSTTFPAPTTADGGLISLQETRLIDNTSVDNFGGGTHDYGYGAILSPADMADSDNWLGNNVKGGAFRIVNTDAVSPVDEEAVGRIPPLWNKYSSLPRDNPDRYGSSLSLKQANISTVTTTAGVPMTPLRKNDENTTETSPPGNWTLMKLALESNSNGSHIALPVTLLPACVHSTRTSVVSGENPFLSPSVASPTPVMTTTFLPSVGEKLDVDVRITEHASDSGQGDSDEDLRPQALIHSLPVINLVRLPCEFGEDDPWKMASAGEALCNEDYVRLQNTTVQSGSKKRSEDTMAVPNQHN
ncbi:hypothetical protein Aperf_G00000126853 [Anoplocephala perfoliata]